MTVSKETKRWRAKKAISLALLQLTTLVAADVFAAAAEAGALSQANTKHTSKFVSAILCPVRKQENDWQPVVSRRRRRRRGLMLARRAEMPTTEPPIKVSR